MEIFPHTHKKKFFFPINPKKKTMAEWLNLAASTFWNTYIPRASRRDEFSESFGCSPEDCVEIWRKLMLGNYVLPNVRPIHLLWTFFFFKNYGTMGVNASTVGSSARTFRDKVFYLIDAISSLTTQYVSFFLVSFFWWVLVFFVNSI